VLWHPWASWWRPGRVPRSWAAIPATAGLAAGSCEACLDYIVTRDTPPRLLAELRDGTRILGVAEVDLSGPARPTPRQP